jgi:hypothetical protein
MWAAAGGGPHQPFFGNCENPDGSALGPRFTNPEIALKGERSPDLQLLSIALHSHKTKRRQISS